jgi:hypothetical protein
LIAAGDFGDRTTIVSTSNNTVDSGACATDMELDQYLQLFTACTIAEVHRDSGGSALLVLDNINVMQSIWFRAVTMIVQARPHLDLQTLMSGDRADLRLFYSSLVQRAAKLLDGGSLTVLITRDHDLPNFDEEEDSDYSAPVYGMREVRKGMLNLISPSPHSQTGWLAGWLADWLVDWVAGWLVG